MKPFRSIALLASTGAALTATAMPASAAATKTVFTGHVSVSAAAGVPAGATLSVVQHCPAGSRLDKAGTREVAPEMDKRLRLASQELWVAGTVARFRVVKAVSARDPAIVLTGAICRQSYASDSATYKGNGATDLRLWGPAPAKVGLVNATISIASDDPNSDDVFRTAMQAAGVDEHPASVRGSVAAVQGVLEEEGFEGIAAVGQTKVSLRGGEFTSLRNHYRFTTDFTDAIPAN